MTQQFISQKLINDIKEAIANKDSRLIKKMIDEMRAADLADLVEHLETGERLFIFDLLEPQGAADVIIEMEAPAQGSILADLDTQAISSIVQELESDDAVDLIGDLPTQRVREIIDTVEDDISAELEKLLPYPDDTAGGLMALEYVSVKADATVEEAIETIREKRDKVEHVYYLWVIDEFDRIVGVVSLKDLVLEPPARKLKDIMNHQVISANVDMDQEEVANLVKKYDLVAIPVVDDNNRLVGRITHDDIIDVIEEEADEDIALMAGVIDQEITENSISKISRARLPWLIGGLAGGLLAAVVINQFESSLKKVLALSFFFPAIMAMAGNTGTQAAAVVVRGLATGDIGLVNVPKRLWMEMKVAMVNGVVCGVLLGIIVGIWLSDYGLGIVVALSLMLIVVNSGFIGAAVPLALKRMNIDPALGTGPFVTTSNDILGLLVYLGLVTLYLTFIK